MLINRVRLENFCVHESLDVELRPGINGIVGPNGSGKSTILGAVRDAVTGVSAGDGVRADNVRHGADSGKFIVDFIHGDTEYSIEGYIGKKSGRKLKTPSFDYTKKDEINSFIEDLTGTTINALLNNIFVSQGDIDSILYSTNTERLKEIQHTIGLIQAADAEKALGTEISRYVVSVGLSEQIEQTESQRSEAENELATAKSSLAEADAMIQALRPAEAVLERALRARQVMARIETLDQLILTRRGTLQEELNGLHAAEKLGESVRIQVDATAPVADQARKDLNEYETDKRVNARLGMTRDRYTAVCESLDKLPEVPNSEIEELTQLLAKRTETLKSQRDMLSGVISRPKLPGEDEAGIALQQATEALTRLGATRYLSREEIELEAAIRVLRKRVESITEENGECPTCGADVDAGVIARWQKELEELTGQSAELSNRLEQEFTAQRTEATQRRDAAQNAVNQFNTAARTAMQRIVSRLQSEVSVLEDNLSTIQKGRGTRQELVLEKARLAEQLESEAAPVWSQDTVDELQAILNKYQLLTTQLSRVSTDLALRQQRVDTEKRLLAEAEKERLEVGDAEVVPAPEELARAKADVEKLSAQTLFRAQLREEIAVVEVRLQQYATTLTRLQEQYRSERTDAKWVALCKRAREALHVRGLPSLMMREYATLLNRRMAYYLRVWEATFELELDQNLAFVARFEDGRVHSAARLSGGQKIVASTSFRLAMADTFAQQVGLLVLDEPSNYLDKENIQHLQQLLLKLKELAGATGKQIIMVTHEESLTGFFDHSVSLYR